jgi:hypothetical protein
MLVKIDRDMLLVELYSLRAEVMNISTDPKETESARKKIDELINLISLAPSSDNNSSFPRISVRRG